MKKKATTEPNESSSQADLTFEQAMKIIAKVPKSVVDERMNQAKKRTKHNGKRSK